uniref:PH domain-containing protein n=1 Tax=Anopheles culicifacies TaxID=139723 RepID=A0A182M2G6_9DIPT
MLPQQLAIRRYLRECEESRREDVEDETYLNVFQANDGAVLCSRDLLLTQCEALLERFEKSSSVDSLLKEKDEEAVETTHQDERKDEEEEEENSYLDMSGSNTLKANNSSTSIVSIGETMEDDEPNDDDTMLFDTMLVQENSYDLTTDQILYDECLQEVDYELEQPPATAVRTSPTPENALPESQCPFGGLPASHLRLQQSPKHGTLFKQEKRLFFDQFKKYYVGLIGKWLLVYNSHNDLKPWQTIFIKSIKLDLNLNEQINEKHLFQIITHTDTKVHFLSPSFQDLNEWIVAIENNLIERVERGGAEECGAVLQVPRKLPLPPCPVMSAESDETDLPSTSGHVEDGIYEEPSLCLKTESDSKAKALGYDTPKPCCTGSNKSNGCNKNKPDLPTKTADAGSGPSTPTPVKSWLKNRFNRSPPDPIDTKLSRKALKKLSFEELPGPECSVVPKSPTKQIPVPSSPKFALATTPTSKGTKINMIISQLEANGQLNLLSKSLTDTNKRYTWVADGVTS